MLRSGVAKELTESIESTLGINSPLQFNELLNLALVAPETLMRVIKSFAIVEIDMSLTETGGLVEELLLLDEPVVDQGAELGIGVGSLKYST